MRTEDTLEYNSLRWVKKELDLILHEAQASLSAYIEDTKEVDRLRECIEHLHMVHGTLQMVELYGAAQLAEEMEYVAAAILKKEIEKTDDAYDVLMRAMLQLPDYLESLQAGNKDVPMVLLPLLNDLRASRNAGLMSENVLFFPNLESEEESAEEIEITAPAVPSGALLSLAKKLRPHFQVGLLGWFKGDKPVASLKRIQAVLGELEKNSAKNSTRRVWSISSALTDGLLNNVVDVNVSIKMLMGQVDRAIKQLIDQGEDAFSRKIPADLLKNLLYYIARVTQDTPKIVQIKKTYRLSELLPGDAELEEARSGLGGLNIELLRTVSQGIREDLLEVKDALEIFVHSESRDPSRISGLPDLLSKISDTLSMLGLGAAREQILSQREKVKGLQSANASAVEDDVMSIAGVLLSVEAQLNSFIASRSGMGDKAAQKRFSELSAMPESEYQEVLNAVIREALQDFSDAKQAILGFLENPNDKSLLDLVLTRLDEVKGAMFMLPVKGLQPQLQSIQDYVSRVLIQAGQVPDRRTQDDLADVVTSIEYYLEAIIEGRPDLELSLGAGDRAAERLNKLSSGFAAAKPAATEVQISKPVAPTTTEKQKAADVPAAKQPPAKPAAPMAKPKSAVPATKRDYKILGDDADEEILEIFIEESLEELASLNEQYPIWRNDPGNTDALTTIRRSFHTLKGSGRLIGAELIGEFSWGFENMLNRVLDRSRPANQEVFDIIDEALSVLPQLIEQLKGNREPIPGVYDLIERADALSKWRPNTVTDDSTDAKSTKSAVAAPERKKSENQSLTEPEMMDFSETEDSIDIGSVEIEPEKLAGLEFETGFTATEDALGDLDSISIDENLNIDLTKDLEDLQVSLESEDETSEFDQIDFGDEAVLSSNSDDVLSSEDILDIGSLEMAADGEMLQLGDEGIDLSSDIVQETEEEQDEAQGIYADPVLFQIFKNESLNHLNQIRALLDAHYESHKPMQVSQELIRALHTLFGSARTADVSEIAELCGEMEKSVRLHQELGVVEISKEGVRVLDDLHHSVSHMLESLSDPEKRIRPDVALLKRIHELSSNVNARASNAAATSVETKTVAKPAASPAKPAAKASAAAKPPVEESLVSYSAVDDELVDIFLEEAEELIDGCENSLQRWNNNNSDTESVMELQRQLHTLKGGARMADLTPIGNLTHSLESLIIAVNEGQLAFTKDMSYVLHDAMDRLSDMLNRVKSRKPIPTAENLIAHIEALRRGEAPPPLKKPDAAAEEEAGLAAEEEIAQEDTEIISEPEDMEISLEDVIGSGSNDNYPLELTEESLLDQPGLEEVSLVEEELVIDEGDLAAELLIEDESTPAETVEVPIIDELPTAEVVEEAPTLKLSKEDKFAAEPQQDETKSGMATEQVRVRADLLNELVNNASEVSVYHARMSQQVSKFGFNLSEMDQTVARLREQLRKLSIETEAQILSRYEKESDQYDEHFDPLEMDRFSTMQQLSRSLQETVGDIESIRDILAESVRDSETLLLQESRVSTDLQEGLLRTRMVHFGGLASRLRRIVRQTARELDKDVDLDISGEANEVDRTVLDRIVAPLEHMLRNAVSHGIELPSVRRSNGKSETGHINIVVDRLGGEVIMKVIDDGRGIDIFAVRKRAIERGLLDSNAKISDREALQFIMQPGFSTAEQVTQISGRGVGMDVVDREIKQLGGVLEIDTIPGKGTTFTIHLPLTLAINHALLVSVSDEVYAVPLNSIEGVVRISGPELQVFYNSGDANYEFAGTRYELKHLGKLLTGYQPDYSRSGQLYPVLLARVGEQRVALHVDDLLGRREVVVKPVGPQISTARGISGATILGDGRVVLILEMSSLLLSESRIHIGEAEQVVEAAPVIVLEEARKDDHVPLVMVVDDSITIRKVTERMLARHGMRVITAKDGVDAVAKLQETMPDVMLLDIEMPRMDGYEVATHVRNDVRLKNLPIIMITSRSGAKHRDKAMEIGVNKYLGKPYQEDDLLKNINELLG